MTDLFQDDPIGVPDESYVLRRICPDWYISDGRGGRRVSSAAFSDMGGAMSVGLTAVLDEMEVAYSAVAAKHDGYGLLRFPVAWLRSELEMAVSGSPTDDEPWHGDVYGKKTDAVRRKFARNGNDWVLRPTIGE